MMCLTATATKQLRTVCTEMIGILGIKAPRIDSGYFTLKLNQTSSLWSRPKSTFMNHSHH